MNNQQIIKRENVAPDLKQPIFIRTLNVFVSPFKKRFDKHYREKRRHLFIDLGFVVIIVALIIINLSLVSKKFDFGPLSQYLSVHTNNSTSSTTIKENSQPSENLIVDKLPAEINLNARYAYYTLEGDQLGVGPWPPVIGETTAVRVFLDLKIYRHNLTNLKVTAKLPDGLEWLGRDAVNKGVGLAFDSSSRKITWLIGDLLVVDGPVQAGFLVSFTGADKVKLLGNISASGFDLSANEQITHSTLDLFIAE